MESLLWGEGGIVVAVEFPIDLVVFDLNAVSGDVCGVPTRRHLSEQMLGIGLMVESAFGGGGDQLVHGLGVIF